MSIRVASVCRWAVIVSVCGLGLAAWAQEPDGGGATAKGAVSGLPVPRFVSLKSDRVNVRRGPGTDHAVIWVFSRAGLPVEVIGESDHWRQVRDSEGSAGWVYYSLLSGRRTALIAPWAKDSDTLTLHERRSSASEPTARLEPKVLGSIEKCDGEWCEFSLDGVSGWVRQEQLWGVYRGEKID